MKLSDYTEEELRAELKRRREAKQEEKKKELRCRNCVHMVQHPKFSNYHLCDCRTWGKTVVRNYSIKPSTKACEMFVNKYH